MLGYGNFRGSGSDSGSSSRGGFGNRGGFRSGGFRGPRRQFGPREMTKITCAECGKEDEVPFKPKEGSSVLCKDCYFKKQGITPRAPMGQPKEAKKEASEADQMEDSENFGDESEENL